MDEIFGELERFGSEVIYPYRWLVLALALVALAAALALAWRFGLHLLLWRRKYVTAAVGIPLLAIAIPAGWYLLSPLWERSFLEEAAPEFDRRAIVETEPAGSEPSASDGSTDPPPTATPVSGEAATPASSPDAPEDTPAPAAEATASARLVAFGDWQGADDFHFARGRALIIEVEPGGHILRVEDFSVRNGPDLFVYLSRNPDGWEEDAVNLGDLKATDGAFNYEIPADVDISEFRSAVVWCKRFAVLFGHATLEVVE